MGSEPVFLNDLAYSSTTADPFRALGDVIAFSVDDWGSSRAMAWVYGIVLGWGDGPDDPDDAHDELARRFGWTPEAVTRLRSLHAAFKAAAGLSPSVSPDAP